MPPLNQLRLGEAPASAGERLAARYARVREATLSIAEGLSAEDCAIQSMPEASPLKWHLAHTTWFFETFVLEPAVRGYAAFNPRFRVLFNSYYNTVGEQHPRAERGQLSRPALEEVLAYRRHVDGAMERFAAAAEPRWRDLVELGMHHEQQHQELMLTDLKHLLSCNPLLPAYRPARARPATAAQRPAGWVHFPEGIRQIGSDGLAFHFDNEAPRHRVFLAACDIAARPVSNGEYLRFIEDGGYRRPELWLSEGWDTVRAKGWDAPLYWRARDGRRRSFTLSGERDLDPAEPVCHVSYFEADAYARWAGARLPTEAEWECAAAGEKPEGNFLEDGALHPAAAPADAAGLRQMFGDVWEWTSSAYGPYPGYRPAAGAVGEYNGKFMVNQYVLRGGSCATPQSHIRASYRNFFPTATRWQFSGIRLARDA
jgi:ergothioneine biosynthesis protein EgtB